MIIKYIQATWSKLRLSVFDLFSSKYKTKYVSEYLPKYLKKETIYVVSEDGFAEHVSMLCPCGCNKVLHMNLIPDEKPCWKILTPNNKPLSLHPSVWRKKGCKSHFWFKNGKVIWCK